MKVLVTGGAGYFGSLLVSRLLAEDYQVRVIDNLMFGGDGLLGFGDKVEVLVGDIRDRKLMRRAVAGVEAVTHLAALVGEPACKDEKLAREINVDATKQLVDLAKKAGVARFVFASSCSVYGPKSVYTITKLEAEKAVLQAANSTFCPVVLRKATLFGLSPRMRFNLLVNEIGRAVVFGEEIKIYNPSSWRPFVSLEDAARAYTLILRLPREKIVGQVFDVVGENLQKRELVQFIRRKWPEAKVKVVPKGGDKKDYQADSRLLNRLGWQPKTKVRRGLVGMVEQIKAGFLAHSYSSLTETWLVPEKLGPPQLDKKIPLITPSLSWQEEKGVLAAIRSTWITEGKKTAEFEAAFAQFIGARYACAVPNGTLALAVALMALDLPKGSQVIVPDLTMAGSVDSVILAGLKPVLADIERKTGNLDIKRLEALIDKKTKVVMPVHLNGRPVEMNKLLRLAKKHRLFVVEDAAQGLGCFYQGKHLGTLGDLGCFSFSTTKILTTAQGGMIATNRKELYEKVLRLKDHGRLGARNIDYHEEIGFNFKFTDLQAAFGLGQMVGLRNRMEKKKEIFKSYKKRLSSLAQVRFPPTDLRVITPWFIEIWVGKRDNLVDYLNKAGIGARRIYPPLHTQPAFSGFKKARDLSGANYVAKMGMWLASSVTLTDNQVKRICLLIKKFYQE